MMRAASPAIYLALMAAAPAVADTTGIVDAPAGFVVACDPLTGMPRDIYGLMQPAAPQYGPLVDRIDQVLITLSDTPKTGGHVVRPVTTLPPIDLPSSAWMMLGGVGLLVLIAAYRRWRR